MYGTGIYFADNSGYSHSFTYQDPDGSFKMFLCFVLPGHHAYDPPNRTQLRIPPLINPGTESVERFDTVMNMDRTHTVSYSNAKSYPAYLINYRP